MKKTTLLPLLMLLVLALLLCSCSNQSQTAKNVVSEQPPTESAETTQTTTPTASEKPEKKSDFPKKAIELVVPYAPGGATDVAARIVANAASKYLPNGQSIVVSNKPGGGGVLGTTELLTTNADGYRLGYGSATPMAVQPAISDTLYTHDSFQPISRVVVYSQAFMVRKDSPWETFEEWLEYAKNNPGAFKYGTQGVGTTAYLTMEELCAKTGIELTHVPFDGAALSYTALLGGHIDGVVLTPSDLNLEELRILAGTGSQRDPVYSDVPTIIEHGYDVSHDLFAGIVAPKGIPQDALEILDEAIRKAMEESETQELLAKAGLVPAYAGPDEFQEQITREFKSYEAIAKLLGIK